jgi:hypothetical protein
LLGVGENVVQQNGIELAVGERQVVHVTLAQTAVLNTGQQQLCPRQLSRIGIDINSDGAFCTRSQQLEDAALTAADVEQVTERRCDRKFDQRVVQPTQIFVVLQWRRDAFRCTQLAEFFEIAFKQGFVRRQQGEQAPA